MAIVREVLSEPSVDRVKMRVVAQACATQRMSEDPVNIHPTREWESPAEIRAIRAKLIQGEQSGFVHQSPEAMLAEFKAELKQDGRL